MKNKNSLDMLLFPIVVKTARAFICEKHHELEQELERYLHILSLPGEIRKAEIRKSELSFDSGLIQTAVSLIIGILANFLTDLFKKSKRLNVLSKKQEYTQLSDKELPRSLIDMDSREIERIKIKIISRIGEQELVEEVIDYAIHYWREGKE